MHFLAIDSTNGDINHRSFIFCLIHSNKVWYMRELGNSRLQIQQRVQNKIIKKRDSNGGRKVSIRPWLTLFCIPSVVEQLHNLLQWLVVLL